MVEQSQGAPAHKTVFGCQRRTEHYKHKITKILRLWLMHETANREFVGVQSVWRHGKWRSKCLLDYCGPDASPFPAYSMAYACALLPDELAYEIVYKRRPQRNCRAVRACRVTPSRSCGSAIRDEQGASGTARWPLYLSLPWRLKCKKSTGTIDLLSASGATPSGQMRPSSDLSRLGICRLDEWSESSFCHQLSDGSA